MQASGWDGTPLSSGFNAMASGYVRQIVFKVFVNWTRQAAWTPNPVTGSGTGVQAGDDITQYVLSMNEQRDITGDTPDGARLVTGQGVASISIDLGGSPTSSAASGMAAMLWSPFASASPYYGRKRIGAQVAVFVGFDTGTIASPHPEYVTKFTGYVRSLNLSADNSRATLEALDPSDRLRQVINFPMVLSGDAFGIDNQRWGMNSQWPIDYALRQNGYLTSPGVRANSLFLMTCHGSLWPEYGTGQDCFAYTYADDFVSPRLTRPYFNDRFGDGLGMANYAPEVNTFDATQRRQIQAEYHFGQNMRLGIGGTATPGIQLEFRDYSPWLIVSGAAGDDNSMMDIAAITIDPGISQSVTIQRRFDGKIALSVQLDGNAANDTVITSNGSITNSDPPGIYIGAHLRLNSTTSVTATFNINGRIETVNATLTIPWANTNIGFGWFLNYWMGVRDIHITNDNTPNWASQTWNAANSSLSEGLNELDVLLPTKQTEQGLDAWSTVSDIANAEFGAAWFTEKGSVLFRNRRALLKGGYDLALTGAKHVKSVETSETVDSIVNHATAQLTPYVVQPYSWVWASSSQHGLHSHETITTRIVLDDPAYGVPTTFTWVPIGGINTSSWNGSGAANATNGYRASRTPEGGAPVTNLQFVVSVLTNVIEVTVTNPNAFPVYMVSPTQDGSGNPIPAASVGQPMFQVAGRLVQAAAPIAAVTEGTATQQANAGAIGVSTKTTSQTADTLDSTSVADYGEQLYPVPDSIWIQHAESAQDTTNELVAELALPIPTVQPIELVGNPCLQLSDRGLLDTSLVNGLSQGAYVVGITTDITADPSGTGEGGLAQTVQARMTAPPGAWILGDQDYTGAGATHSSLSRLPDPAHGITGTTRLGHI